LPVAPKAKDGIAAASPAPADICKNRRRSNRARSMSSQQVHEVE
jgi:hypothetical protein